MARIPDEEIARLKAEVAVERLAVARGVELTATGDDLVGCCPFCDGGDRSLVVSPGRNVWRCSVGCGAGSVIDWVMRAEGVSFRHAVELLRNGAPTSSAGTSPNMHLYVRFSGD